MPLAEQLRQLFEDDFDEVSVALTRKSSDKSYLIQSILDGLMYQRFLRQIDDDVERISLTFTCDGVPLFKSSGGSSLYPVLCINELPMEIRKRHVLMPAIFYGKKPDMNQYLFPFVKETNELYTRGFMYYRGGQEHVCRVGTLLSVPDSVGRPTMQNFQMFNGEFGCCTCYHPGEQVAKDKGTVRVNPHLADVSNRTCEETKLLAQEASATERKPFHVKGVKGETVLSYMTSLDVIRGIIPEYMHSSILGTPRQMAKLWFKPQYHEKNFYIGNKIVEVDERLRLLQPPFYVSRPPRCVKEMKFWKAHEWYAWTLYFSVPVLKGILPNRLLQHWMLFCEGLFLLLQESVSKSQIHNSTQVMIQFTKGVEELYGLEHCSFNIHLGEHLGGTVSDWGPLWDHSAFLFEDYNQVLLSMVQSSKRVLEQIVKGTRTERSISSVMATPAGAAVSHMNVAKRERLLSTKNSVSCSKENCDVLVLAPEAKAIKTKDRLAFASMKLPIQPEK